ncbi:MAG: hypothetical protein E2O37_05720 [Proteobacteria bacterium]|nr:MAG: hypothetical protein E2O37_05720 [Pseudomonadota bacterium]TDJ68450.1 MAG: hypothetical protein E2O38_15665 [Pseudomonadota bacterium]
MSPTKSVSKRTAKWRATTCLSLTLLLGISATCSMSTERIVPALQKAIAKPSDEYVLAAAPDRSTTIAHQTYGPIVDYLSQITGKRIVYRHSPDWRTYQQAMQQGEYDLAFDGSHFVSWRISRLEHEPLVKAAQEDIFVVLASRRDHHLNLLQDLVGRSVCGHAPPHYTTLRVYHEFDNPARQPILIREQSWQAIYQAMITGKCDGAIMSLEAYHQVDPDGRHARIVFKSKAIPGQTLTAGPRLSPEDKAAITRALLSPEGRKVTKRLRQQLGATKITRATKSEYAGLDTILNGMWGFHI